MAVVRAACLASVLLIAGGCADVEAQLSAAPAERALAGQVEQAADAIDTTASGRAAQARHAETEIESDDPAKPADPRDAPEGYVAVRPFAPPGSAHADTVVLIEPNDGMVLPIFIGGSEALSIRMRLAEKSPSRPLTHDLLDALSKELGAKLVRVQVDGLRRHTFVGSVYFERNGKLIRLDARPSDAIALAIGNGAPIYVSEEVLQSLGITAEELHKAGQAPASDSVSL